MLRVPGTVTALACFCAVAGTASARAPVGVIKPILVAVSEADEPGYAINTLDEPSSFPPNIETQRHYYNPSTGESGEGAMRSEDEPIPVYSNTGGAVIYSPGSNRLIADDVTTAAIGGCHVSGYEILVGVSGSEGGGDPYTIEVGIWDACPGASPPGQLVPGTDALFEDVPDDGQLHLLEVDLEGSEVPMGSTFWLGVKFSGNSLAGWVSGSPADVGFTQDIFDFPHPALRCNARTGVGYSGFYVQIWCSPDPPFPREFLGYYNPDLDARVYVPGSGQWMADDITLIVDECELSSLEVAILGTTGFFNMDVELWGPVCGPEDLIEGTQRTYEGRGDGDPEVARFEFLNQEGHGIDIGGSLWIAWRFDNSSTGPIQPGEPVLGESDDWFALLEPNQTCSYWWWDGNPYAAFNATIRCLGEAPRGACCEFLGSEWRCREAPQISCVGAHARWLEDTPCDPDPFDPPCGGFACCLPEPWPRGSCENLNEEDCDSDGGVWDGRELCGFNGQDCGWFACREADGDCDIQHDSVGCTDMSCCSRVCDEDAYCCEEEWDTICAREAKQLCCPAAEVVWSDPPNGVVDARQPHPVDDMTAPQGIDTIRAIASQGASKWCWTLCETEPGESPNFIKAVEETAATAYTITLDRPITPGAVTTISYYGDDGSTGTGRFTSHPGNVDGDGEAGPPDILALVDSLGGVDSLPWSLYSCDVDRSGSCGPADILRVVDLLNGAGDFVPWDGTLLPSESRVCP